MYQTQGATVAYKEDLSNTILLSNHLGNPETNHLYMLLELMAKVQQVIC
jgi:hypothetical protein